MRIVNSILQKWSLFNIGLDKISHHNHMDQLNYWIQKLNKPIEITNPPGINNTSLEIKYTLQPIFTFLLILINHFDL